MSASLSTCYKKPNTALIRHNIVEASTTRDCLNVNNVYYLTSNDMDELNNLIRIEELCPNLREQQEQQRHQHSPPIVTPTG